MEKALYYESHITVEPVFNERLAEMKAICEPFRFRVADLLMKKRPEDTATRSAFDTFCTGRGQSGVELSARMTGLVRQLEASGFTVWRYKLEAALIDTKVHTP